MVTPSAQELNLLRYMVSRLAFKRPQLIPATITLLAMALASVGLESIPVTGSTLGLTIG